MIEPFALTPPDGNGTRFTAFRDSVLKFYQWKWGRCCPWDGAEANQLSRLLKSDPTLSLQDFRLFLYNYGCSDDITPGERPRSFLPRIHDYSVTPLDRFRRNPNAKIETASSQRSRRNDTAFEQARQNRRIAPDPKRNFPAEGIKPR